MRRRDFNNTLNIVQTLPGSRRRHETGTDLALSLYDAFRLIETYISKWIWVQGSQALPKDSGEETAIKEAINLRVYIRSQDSPL